MQPAIIKKTQTKVHGASVARVKVAHQQTFKEWLAEEAAAGRIIAPKNVKKLKMPEKPEAGLDWLEAYEYTRSDRF
ncbi:MAG: hypothetical protein LBC87_08150 [Fibromonadaceae bacterium]|jgi:hypothetical protein|nr:hypothetical protein [Fibromonadaceae bacterium]